MTLFIDQAKQYAQYHQNQSTIYAHMAGIPLLILSLLVLLGFLHLVIPGLLDIKFADIAILALLIWYFTLNWLLALVLLPVFIVLLWIADFFNYSGPTAFGLWTFVILFLLGCALQFVGHFFEGKRPPFKINLWQMLLAPMFLTAELFFMAGRMESLKKAIHGKEGRKK